MSARTSVQVPASSANLGGGFDCVGIALDCWLRLEASLAPETAIERRGTLAALDLEAAEDRIIQGFAAACAAAHRAAEPLRIIAESAIPIGKGLGSSAAATVAGALAANQLLDLGLGQDQLLACCAAVEGHPDNVAPALLGGAVLVAGGLVRPLELHEGLALVIAVPDFSVETRRSRAILPEFVPHRTASNAAARAAALVQGLATGDPARRAAGLDDVLHVPFRHRLIPGYRAVTRAAVAAGAVGATLSGSGSSILAVTLDAGSAPAIGAAMLDAWAEYSILADILQPSIVREVLCP